MVYYFVDFSDSIGLTHSWIVFAYISKEANCLEKYNHHLR